MVRGMENIENPKDGMILRKFNAREKKAFLESLGIKPIPRERRMTKKRLDTMSAEEVAGWLGLNRPR